MKECSDISTSSSVSRRGISMEVAILDAVAEDVPSSNGTPNVAFGACIAAALLEGDPAATSPLKSLHEGTRRGDLSLEQFTRSVLCKKSQRLVPKIQTGLKRWPLRLDFEAKMASPHDVTSPAVTSRGD